MNRSTSVLIVGGGIIGCSIALELAKQGVKTAILDKGSLLAEATSAAAGMLGAQVETHHPGPFYELCKASQRLYKEWAEDLHSISGTSPQYIAGGILRAALTEEDEAELRGRLAWMDGASWISAEAVRQIEPSITPLVRGGIHFEQDHQIHPVHTGQALRAALLKLGVTVQEWTPALELLKENGRITGVRTTDGRWHADHVVLTAGAWSSSLLEPVGLHLPMFPVKGQCISVRMEKPVISSTVFMKGCYIVPKLDGSLTIGATQEAVGFDKKATLSVIAELHRRASSLIPALEEAEFISTWAGLRPGTPDGLPYMGQPESVPGLVVATGHYRNGILLAPVTGKAILALLTGTKPPINLTPYAPERVQVTI